MLPKLNRIKKKNDFKLIFEKAKSFKSPFLVLRAMENGAKITRAAFIVSLKISKKAVIRNKIRRRMSFAFEEICLQGKIKTGMDLVFIALPGIEKKDFAQIKPAINNLLEKSKCLNQ